MNRAALAVIVGFLVFTDSSAAASPNVAWTGKDMKAAIHALGYPKPHAKKLTCKGLGAADAGGRHSAFRCVATFKGGRHRAFYTEGKGLGGWICAGAKLATCQLLKRGFVSASQVALDGSIEGAAEVAARGYVQNRYDTFDTYPAGLCTQKGPRAWSCGYKLDTGTITVTITLSSVKSGYVVVAAAVVSS